MDGHSNVSPDDANDLGHVEIAQATGEPIGQVESAKGKASVVRVDGSTEPAEAGMDIFQGDEIVTEGDGAIGLVFVDNSTFSLAEDGSMVIDEMVYDPAAEQGSALFNVTQGVFTFVSGEIAKTTVDAMQIETPVATIGIRGTTGGGTIFNPPGSTQPPRGQFVNFRDAVDGQPGEFVVSTPTGSRTLSGINSMTNIPNPFVPPSLPVNIPGASLRQVFANAISSLPRPPAINPVTGNQNNNQPGGNQQGQGGNTGNNQALANTLTATDAPSADAAGVVAAAEAAAAEAFAEVLAQGGDIGSALEAASEIAGETVSRFGVDPAGLDSFTDQTAADEVIEAALSASLGGLGGFGPSNPLSAGGGQAQFEAEVQQQAEQVAEIVAIAIIETQFAIVDATIENALALAEAGLITGEQLDGIIEDQIQILETTISTTTDGLGDGPGDFLPGGPDGGVLLGGGLDDDLFDPFFEAPELLPPPEFIFNPDEVTETIFVSPEGTVVVSLSATTGDDALVGGDGVDEAFMTLGQTMMGTDTFDGGDGTDELTFLNLEDGWITYEPGAESGPEVQYNFFGGSYTGTVDLTSVEQLFANDQDNAFSDIGGVNIGKNSFGDAIQLPVTSTDSGVGLIYAGTIVADTIDLTNSGDSVLSSAGISPGQITGSLIMTSNGNDNVTGSSYVDHIFTDSDDDTIDGGGGDDVIVGGGGSDVITGGSGNDQINVATSSSGSSVDTIVYNALTDFNTSTSSGDIIYNFGSNDIIDVNFSLRGTNFEATGSALTVNSGTGIVNYTTSFSGIDVGSTVASTLQGVLSGFSSGDTAAFMVTDGTNSNFWYWSDSSSDGSIDNGELNLIANFQAFDSSTLGTAFSGFTDPFAGANTITGTAGNDTVNSGAGNDQIYTFAGTDTINAGADDDTIFVGVSSTGLAALASTHVDGSIDGGTGTDTIQSYANNDFTGVTLSNVEIHAFQGNAHTVTFSESQLTGGLTQFNANSVAANNLIVSMTTTSFDLSSGFTFTNGAANNHTITVNGTSSGDTITGSATSGWTSATESLNGNAGADTLNASSRTQTLDGGEDGDVYVFAASTAGGSDIISDSGSSGNDTLRVDGDNDFSNVNTLAGIEIMQMNGAGTATFTAAHFDTFSTFNFDTGTTETVNINFSAGGTFDFELKTYNNFTDGTDTLNFTDSTGNETIATTDLADNITISTGNDTVNAGSGNDTITVAASNLTSADTINGNAGTDTLSLTGGGTLTDGNFTGTATLEQIQLDDAAYNLTFGTEVSAGFVGIVVNSNQTSNALTLDASAISSDVLTVTATASTAADTIVGTSQADTINVGGGGDSITGGGGADNITLGSGQDTVIYGATGDFGDTVTSFTAGSGGDVFDYNVSVSRGSGTLFQSLTTGNAIDGNTGVVNYTTTISAYNMATAVASELNLTGFASGDDILIVTSNGTDSQVWRYNAGTGASIDSAELTAVATLSGVNNASLVGDNFDAFTDGSQSVSGTQSITLTTSLTNSITGSSGTDTLTLQGIVASGDNIDLAGGTDTLILGTGMTFNSQALQVSNTETVSFSNNLIGSSSVQFQDTTSVAINNADASTSDSATVINLTSASGTLNQTWTFGFFLNNSGNTANSSINMGDGTDTLAFNNLSGSFHLLSSHLQGVESLNFGTGNATVTIDTALASLNLTSINSSSILSASLVDISSSLAINLAQSDTSTLTLNAATAATYTDTAFSGIGTRDFGGGIILGNAQSYDLTIGTNFRNAFQSQFGNAKIDATATGSASITVDADATFDSVRGIAFDGSGASGTQIVTATGHSSGDSIIVGTGTVVVTAEAGTDTIQVTASSLDNADTIDGGADTDTLSLTGGGTLADSVWSGKSNLEQIQLDDNIYNLTFGANANTAFSSGVTINTNQGSNALTLSAETYSHGVVLNGSGNTASDSIVGSAGADTLKTGGGNDSIRGGANADTLTGGSGADTFAYATTANLSNSLIDTITDFSTGDGDLLDFSGIAVNRGAGNVFESLASGNAVAANTGVVNYTTDVADPTATVGVSSALSTLTGLSANDSLFFVVGNSGSPSTRVWYWDDSSGSGGNGDGNVDAGELLAVTDASNLDNDTLTASNFSGFS